MPVKNNNQVKNKENQKFVKELKENRKAVHSLLKPKIDYDKENDIFYLWFGGNHRVESTIEVSSDMRFDINKNGNILSVEIEDFKNKLK